jgi:hypothetical protein
VLMPEGGGPVPMPPHGRAVENARLIAHAARYGICLSGGQALAIPGREA